MGSVEKGLVLMEVTMTEKGSIAINYYCRLRKRGYTLRNAYLSTLAQFCAWYQMWSRIKKVQHALKWTDGGGE